MSDRDAPVDERKEDEDWRKTRLRGKAIKEVGIIWPYILIPIHIITLKPLLFYLKTVITEFFLLQFKVKWGWRKAAIALVSDSIDEDIPYLPEKSDIYLDFINFWIRSLNFTILRLGRKKAIPHLARFMTAIGTAYHEAARVYKITMSTTPRPAAGNHKNMKTIHRLDPHLLCVPSLHVGVVVLTHTFFTHVFRKEGLSQEEQEQYSQELWAGAVEIAETVLYVKQHSVNCIPAALYMMTHLLKDQFTIQDATNFIDCLFVDTCHIPAQQGQIIRNHIHYMFDRLLLEGCQEEDWIVPVVRWLANQPVTSP